MRGDAQLTLDLGLAPALSDTTFLIGPGNAEAATLIARWPDWRAPSLLLVGPEASGKSHLVKVWAERSGARVLRAADISMENVAGIAAAPAVAIEDMGGGMGGDMGGNMGDEPTDEAALFHLLNAMREAGRALLLTARAPSSAWGIALADLRSRLGAIPLVRLDAPDDELLIQLAHKLFAERQIEVPGEVVDYVIHRMERSVGAVTRLVETADRLSLAAKTPITRNVVAEALRRLEGEAA